MAKFAQNHANSYKIVQNCLKYPKIAKNYTNIGHICQTNQPNLPNSCKLKQNCAN